MTANILKNECHDAQVDPDFEPLTGKVLVSSVNSSDEIPCVCGCHGNVNFIRLS